MPGQVPTVFVLPLPSAGLLWVPAVPDCPKCDYHLDATGLLLEDPRYYYPVIVGSSFVAEACREMSLVVYVA